MLRHWQYLKYVLRHKWFVFRACWDLGVPLWIAIVHDWDKFLPDEWIPYARTFYDKSGNKQYKEYPAFSTAWNAHQKRNKHHWQYWMLTWDRGETECLPMPDVYIREMVADWRGAGKALGKPNTCEWYYANRDKIQLHPASRKRVEELIKYEDFIDEIIAVTNNISPEEVKRQRQQERAENAFKSGAFG